MTEDGLKLAQVDLIWSDDLLSSAGASNEVIARYAINIAEQYGINASIISLNSSGGWPELRFMGSRDKLSKFIKDEYDSDASLSDYEDDAFKED